MSRRLLDTHWLLGLLGAGDVQITAPMRKAVQIKHRLGKLELHMPIEHLPASCTTLGLSILPIVPTHVLAAVSPEPPTRDPLDRLLLAQVQCEGMRLVTLDRALVSHPLAWSPQEPAAPSAPASRVPAPTNIPRTAEPPASSEP